jgi:hypothetical protein
MKDEQTRQTQIGLALLVGVLALAAVLTKIVTSGIG